jgi:Protein of unknown function (DUF3551)
MKTNFAVLGLLMIAAACFGTPAAAQNYPWCEYLGGGMGGGGGKNCGFISFEQCMQSAWGNGGDCRQNTQYEPPPGEHPPLQKQTRRKPQKNS